MKTETPISVTNIEEMGSVYWMRINDRYDFRFSTSADGCLTVKVYSREDSLNGSGRHWPYGDCTDEMFLVASLYPDNDNDLTIRDAE